MCKRSAIAMTGKGMLGRSLIKVARVLCTVKMGK